MNYGIRRELEFYRRLPGFLYYAFVLIREILMANLNVCRLILSEKEEIRDCLSPFVSCGKCLYPPQEGVHKDQEVLGTSDSGYVGKVKLTVSSRKGTSSLMGRKRGCYDTLSWS